MSVYLEIQSVHAREILDSRGNPTVEAEVCCCCYPHCTEKGLLSCSC